MEYLDIGGTPVAENCAQTGSKTYDYAKMNQLECNAYIIALKRKYGEPPEGARYRVHANPHDFGTYYDVRLVYDGTLPDAREYAFKAEEGLGTWADVGMWAPVSYSDTGAVIYVIEDADLWLKETNPHSRNTRELRDADLAQTNAGVHPGEA